MNTLWGNIFLNSAKQDSSAETLTTLKKIPIFEELSSRELRSLHRILHQRLYVKDEVIFHEGDPGMGMYIIREGGVRIMLEDGQQVLAELKTGEFFGELALLDESPRSATAVASTQSKILGLFYPDLLGLIERQPTLGVKIILNLGRIVGVRLRRSNDQILEFKKELERITALQQR